MRKIALSLVLIMSLLATLPVMGVSVNKSVISEDANWLIHINSVELRKTGLYQYFNSEFRDKLDEAEQKVIKELDMDLNKDVDSVTIFGNGNFKGDFAVHVVGIFNEKRLIKALKKKDAKFKTIKYGKNRIYNFKDEAYAVIHKKTNFFFARSEKGIKKIIDNVKRGSVSNSGLIKKLEGMPENSFFIGIADDVANLAGMHSKAVMLQQAEVATFMAVESNRELSLNLALQTKSEETALQLEQMLKGLIAFGSMQSEQLKGLEVILKKLNVSKSGRALKVNLTMSSDKIIAILKDKMRCKNKKCKK